MKARTKRVILISTLSLFTLVVATLVVGVAYVVKHPEAVKGVIETTLSTFVHGEVTIEHLSLETAPFQLRISGLHVTAPPRPGWPALEVALPELTGRFEITGSFGQRRLVIKSVDLRQPTIHLTSSEESETAPTTKPSPGPLGALLGSLFKKWVFREVVFDHGEIEGGLVTAQLGDKRLRVHDLNVVGGMAQGLHVSLGAEVFTEDGALRVVAPLVRWESEHLFFEDQKPIEGTLTVVEARLKEADLEAQASGITINLVCKRSEDRLDFEVGRSMVSGVRLERAGTVFGPPQDIHLAASGRYDLTTGQFLLNTWTIEMADVLNASGSMGSQPAPSAPWSIHLDHSRIRLAPLLKSLGSASLSGLLSDITLDGMAQISGDLSASESKAGSQWLCDLEVSATEGVMALTQPDLMLRAKWTGQLHAKGPVSDPTITSGFKASEILVRKGNDTLNNLSIQCSIQGKSPLFNVKDLSILLPEQPNAPLPAGVEIWPVGFQSPGAVIDLRARTMSMETGTLTSPLFGQLMLSSSVSEKGAAVTLRGKSLPLPKRIGQPGSLLGTLVISGEGTVGMKANIQWGDSVHLTGDIEYGPIGFQDPEGIWSGQGLQVRTGFEARFYLTDSRIVGKGWFEVPDGELLLDRFYFNLGQDRLTATGQFAVDLTKRQAEVLDGKLEYGDLLGIRTDARFGWADRMDERTLHVQLRSTPIAPLYERFLKDPFKLERPRLNEITVGGLISADVRMASSDEGHRLLGHLDWENGKLEWETGQVQISGVQLKLPLWEESGVAVDEKGPGDGFLRASSVTFPFVPPQRLSLALAVGPNKLSIPAAFSIETRGGAIRLGGTSCEECFQATRRIRTSLAIKDMDLRPFLPSPWHNLDRATMDGDLRPVEIVSDTVHTKGQVRLRIFGGEIRISHIGVEDLATPSPKYICRIDATNLDLAQLTEGTEFGKIEGVLQVHVENAVFSRGQPLSFDLVLETVKKEGVPQRISVKALDNIARIGGGGSPFVGMAGTFLLLFKELPYDKIGIRARLENDVFRINGTIKEGGKEYLVKRGGLAGVDVINQNPDNRIGFKDMIKRLKRISSAQ